MEREMITQAPPLCSVRVSKPLAAVNRLLMVVHAVLAATAITHRARLLFDGAAYSLRHVAMLAADLTLLSIWALSQAAMWRPVTRAVFPDRLLLRRSALPGVDVMIVTADPEKEPTVEVMNTVLSAMALDYPAEKLNVYLSDDARSPLTLLAARKAYAFARAWVPFCRKYQVQCPCPSRYFAAGDNDHGNGVGLAEERLRIKKMYQSLTDDVAEAKEQQQSSGSCSGTNKEDHEAHVEVVIGDKDDGDGDGDGDATVPSLVYVSREKRRTSAHHFKAGALNVLLRVSSLMSNSPYVLVLDCDMKCNSRSSAMEAMCFHLEDTEKRQNLAFVQFPQMFHNLSPKDIYANELRAIFSTRWKGLDGLRGPILSGTGFYARRDALYGATAQELCSMDSGELERRFGRSSDLVASVRSLQNQQQHSTDAGGRVLPRDAVLVASCAYEEEETAAGTGWGRQVGFLYQTVVEDYFTGYRQLFCRGWTSVYCYLAPASRPAFLGSVPTCLNDVLVQNKRWMSGMLAVGLSRHCPLLCPASLAVSVLQSMSFAYYALVSVSAFPVLCYGVLLPLCSFRGVPLFPFPGSRWFAAAFVSSSLQHLIEVWVAKGRRLAVRTWWNEQRFWMLSAVTAQLFACITVFLDLIGAGTVMHFDLTSKAKPDDKLYQDGVFDFTGCSALLLPATTLSALNIAALVAKMPTTISDSAGELLPHFFLMCYVAALSYPLLEGMFLRQDAAKVPGRITAVSVALAAALLAMFG